MTLGALMPKQGSFVDFYFRYKTSALLFYTSTNAQLYSSVISVPLKLRYLDCFYQTTIICLVSTESHITDI